VHVTIFRHGETLNYESMYLQMKSTRVITHTKQQYKYVYSYCLSWAKVVLWNRTVSLL